jgi:two-component system response regulator ArlR
VKLLVIEDDKTMRENIVHFLQKENYLIETAQDLNTALDKVNIYTYDCILLDITLPDGSGFEILRELKKMNKTDGVIIISAKDSLDDKLSGLDLGADDYLPKPFHMAELNARIKSVLRRRKFEGSEMIVLNNMTVDSASRLVFINGIELVLNRKEYDILLYFLSNKNRLVAKTALAENVWGDNIDSADSFEFIYSQIRNLRKKLKENKAEIEIQAIYGIGYKLITA